jgi:hypothetical protein
MRHACNGRPATRFVPRRIAHREGVGDVRSILYDADGNETADEALAVRGTTVEVDDDGEVLAELESWEADETQFGTREGSAATRPRDVEGDA